LFVLSDRRGCARAATGISLSPALLSCACAILVVAPLAVAHAQSQRDAGAFLSRLNAAIGALNGQTGARALEACAGLVASLLDVDAIAPVGAGRSWEEMSVRQRALYRSALAARLARDCVSENKDNAGQPASLVGERRADNGDLLVATRVEQAGAAGHTIIWRFRAASERQSRAIDLQVDGRSTALAFRDEAEQAFERSGGDVEAVIRSLGQ
jgi:ABC-type transporter MlaC component